MRFLNPFFLYLLPLAFVPLILYLIERIKRKRMLFSSLELIEEILKEENRRIHLNIFFKNIIKSLILFLIILAFSNPIVEKNIDLSKHTAVIDPTLSMSDFDLNKILTFLREKGVKKIYFGNKEIREENIIYQKNIDIISLINSIEEKEVILISDAQKSNFKNLKNIKKNIIVLLLYHTNITNYYFKKIEIFPEILTKESEIFIKADINLYKEIPVLISINDKIIYEEKTKRLEKSFMLDQSILIQTNKIKIKLEANDFQSDNEVILRFFYTPTIKVFINIKDISVKQYIIKTLRALFGNVEETFEPSTASISFINNFDPNINGIVFTIPENFENQKISFFAKNDYHGRITSDFNIEIENFSLRSVYEIVANIYNLKPVVKINDKPIIYKIKDNYLFTFSLKDNLKDIISSPIIPIFFYETIKDYYNLQKKYSIEEESVFEFLRYDELKKYFNTTIEYDKINENTIKFFLILIVIGVVLFLIEIFN